MNISDDLSVAHHIILFKLCGYSDELITNMAYILYVRYNYIRGCCNLIYIYNKKRLKVAKTKLRDRKK